MQKTYKKRRKRNERRLILINIIVYIMIILISIFFVLSFMLSRITINDETMSSLNGYSAQTVISGSMVPTLNVYDVVLVKSAESYNMGDIITYCITDENGDIKFFTHRIVSIGDTFYITKGDANQQWDDWIVEKENVIGRVEYIIPKIGKFILKLAKLPIRTYKIALVISFAILMLAIVFETLHEATRELTKKELQLLEISKYQRLNMNQKRYLLWIKFKRFIQK